MTPLPSTKMCRGCEQTLPRSEFWKGKNKEGLLAQCKTCLQKKNTDWVRRNPEKVSARSRRDYESRRRLQLRLQRYGLSEGEYDEMVERQEGKCALCGNVPKVRQLGVDHDHSTGAVRGLLCVPCNAALGRFGDSVEGLERVIRYLKGEPL